MNRLAALIAESTLTPWAIRSEALDALASAIGRGGRAQGFATGGLIAPGQTYIMGEEGPEMFLSGARLQEHAGVNAAIHPATERATARKAGAVAYVPVKGVIQNRMSVMDYIFGIGSASPAAIVANVRAAIADESVKAVVLGIDSPGGVVTGVPEAADAIFKMRGTKPIIAQVEGQMCSAAYHIGCSADEIVATPSAQIGSLGVYLMHADFSKWDEEMGVKFTYIHAGKYKVEGNEDEPLTKEATAHLQETVDDYMDLFMAGVARGRGVAESVARGERFGQGRAYAASRAVERGLADKVRTLEDTFATYGATMGKPQETTRRTSVALARRRLDLQG